MYEHVGPDESPLSVRLPHLLGSISRPGAVAAVIDGDAATLLCDAHSNRRTDTARRARDKDVLAQESLLHGR